MVDYINYEGKKYPVKLAMIAIKSFESEGGNLNNMGEDLRQHAHLLWHAIKVGYEKIGKPFFKEKKKGDEVLEVPILSIEDCYWILDESFTQYFEIFISSMAKITGLTDEQLKSAISEEVKKK